MSEIKNNKKPFYKKWWFWVIIAFVVIGAIGSAGNKDSTVSENVQSTVQPTVTPDQKKAAEAPKPVETTKPTVEPTTKPTVKPTAVPVFDISTVEISKENVAKAIEKVIPTDKLKEVDITEKDGVYTIDVYFNPGTVWDEKDLVQQTAITATSVMEILFKNAKVGKVWLWTQTEMTDAKGNSSMENVVNVALSKENAKDINWSKFKTMVSVDYKALFNIADGSFIHPAIAKNLK